MTKVVHYEELKDLVTGGEREGRPGNKKISLIRQVEKIRGIVSKSNFSNMQSCLGPWFQPSHFTPVSKNLSFLDGVAQWIELWPENQRVTDSIPSQDTCLGSKRQAHIDVSLYLVPFSYFFIY